MTARNDMTEVLGLKHNGQTVKCRPGEHIRFSLGVEVNHGYWRSETATGGGVVRRIKSQARRTGPVRFNYLYEAIAVGQSTIQMLYLVRGVIEKVFKLTVQVVPEPAPPPIESVYQVLKCTSRPIGDAREHERQTSTDRFGICCSLEGVEELIEEKHPGLVVKWSPDASYTRIDIQIPSPKDDREVYISIERIPLHR